MSFSYAFLTQFDSWCMAATWHVFSNCFPFWFVLNIRFREPGNSRNSPCGWCFFLWCLPPVFCSGFKRCLWPAVMPLFVVMRLLESKNMAYHVFSFPLFRILSPFWCCRFVLKGLAACTSLHQMQIESGFLWLPEVWHFETPKPSWSAMECMILLMEEILHQLICRWSHYLQGFHPSMDKDGQSSSEFASLRMANFAM